MRTPSNERPVMPPWALRLMAVGAVAVLVGAATPPGAAAAGGVQRFLAFFAGVFALVAMSLSVVSGLAATERMILGVRHRVLAQALHRAGSLLAFTFLVAHIMVKVLSQHATPAQIVVPYSGPVGLGALAFDLLLVTLLTGVMRVRFAAARKPGLWRFFHVFAYVSWPIAITHGLTAGRTAAPWVVWSYALCMVVVGIALLTRLMVTVRPRLPERPADPATADLGAQVGAEVGAAMQAVRADLRADREAEREVQRESALAEAALFDSVRRPGPASHRSFDEPDRERPRPGTGEFDTGPFRTEPARMGLINTGRIDTGELRKLLGDDDGAAR